MEFGDISLQNLKHWNIKILLLLTDADKSLASMGFFNGGDLLFYSLLCVHPAGATNDIFLYLIPYKGRIQYVMDALVDTINDKYGWVVLFCHSLDLTLHHMFICSYLPSLTDLASVACEMIQVPRWLGGIVTVIFFAWNNPIQTNPNNF